MTFSPLNSGTPGQMGRPQNPVQDAIKLLSFRMPATVGAGAGAAPSLLGAPQLGAQVGNGVAGNWLMQLLQGLVQNPGSQTADTSGSMPGAAPGTIPPPKVQFPQQNIPQQNVPQTPPMPIPMGGGMGMPQMQTPQFNG
jgi:hypothetical protein